MLVAVIIVVFIIGLAMFLANRKKLGKAIKEGWEEGVAEAKAKDKRKR